MTGDILKLPSYRKITKFLQKFAFSSEGKTFVFTNKITFVSLFYIQ